MKKKLLLTSWTLLLVIAASGWQHRTLPVSLTPNSLQNSIFEFSELSEKGVHRNHIKLFGYAMNFTADEESNVKIDLKKTDDGYKGTIQWDNISLYGAADVKTTQVEHLVPGIITLKLTGTFDCGGVGGWPEGTYSDFSSTIHLQADGQAFGSYLIHGSGRLPMQHGDFNFTKADS